MSNAVRTSIALRFLAISALTLSALPWSLGATPAAAAPLPGDSAGAISDVRAARQPDLHPTARPDLHPTALKVINVPGSTQRLLCAAIENIGTGDAGPFDVAFKINGAQPAGGLASAGMLKAGQNGELCVQLTLPATGKHTLSAVVDSGGTVLESNEANNEISRGFLGTALLDVKAPNSVGNSLAP